VRTVDLPEIDMSRDRKRCLQWPTANAFDNINMHCCYLQQAYKSVSFTSVNVVSSGLCCTMRLRDSFVNK